MEEILSTAESYIAAGIKCIPVHKGTKFPKNSKWSTEFLDSSAFRSLYTAGDNFGVVTGKVSGIICIDIDKKSNGLAWYEKHKDSLGTYLEEKTPGGGLHLYYLYPSNLEYVPSCNTFAPGVEVKADGGRYVVTAPSSNAEGKPYTMWHSIPLSEVPAEAGTPPEWIINEITSRAHKRLEDPSCITLEGDIDRAIAYVSKMPPAISGNLGDQSTYQAACRCRAFGLTQIQAFEVLEKHFNPRCIPPWKDNDLKQKIINAYRYDKEPQGAKLQPATVPTYTKTNVFEFIAKSLPPKEHIIGPFVKQGLNMVYAPPGVGKTYFALSLAFAIATGGKFLNWQCECIQKVIYFDGELPGYVLQDRLRAFISHSGATSGDFCIVTPDEQKDQMPDLSDPKGQQAALELIGDAQFIVLDNVSTLCRSGKENDAESWIPVQSWLLELRKMGKSVLLVHHTGKGEALSPRGTSKREDVLDLVIGLSHPVGYKATDACRFEMKFRKSRHFRNVADIEEIVASFGANGWEIQGLNASIQDQIRNMFLVQQMTQKAITEKLGISKGYVSQIVKALTEESPRPVVAKTDDYWPNI